jgi:hypothetical protein
MSGNDLIPTDPAKLLDNLDANAIQKRLDDMEREERALRVLLRSARARQRKGGSGNREASDAD